MRVRPRPWSTTEANRAVEKTPAIEGIMDEQKKLKKETETELTIAKDRVELEKARATITNRSSKSISTNSEATKTRTLRARPSIKNTTNTWKTSAGEDTEWYNNGIPYDLSDYKVIHIDKGSNGKDNCARIARLNQQKILDGSVNKNFVLYGDAEYRVDLNQELYAKSWKKPWESIKVNVSGINRVIEFTWIHDDVDVINSSTWDKIKNYLDRSRKNAKNDSALVREMFIATAHRHRVTLVYGTDTYTPITKIPSGKNSKGQTIYKTVIGKPYQYTWYRAFDTLRWPWKRGKGTLDHWKVPLHEYFVDEKVNNNFYFGGEMAGVNYQFGGKTHKGVGYKDIYLRSWAPIGYEPRWAKWSAPKGNI